MESLDLVIRRQRLVDAKRGTDVATAGEGLVRVVAHAMTELGVNLSEAYPKSLTDEIVRAADVVITMDCGDACPIYPGKRCEDWEFADPGEARFVDEARTIRDEMDERITKLVAELLAA